MSEDLLVPTRRLPGSTQQVLIEFHSQPAAMIRALSGLLWLDAASQTAACTVFAVGKMATKALSPRQQHLSLLLVPLVVQSRAVLPGQCQTDGV